MIEPFATRALEARQEIDGVAALSNRLTGLQPPQAGPEVAAAPGGPPGSSGAPTPPATGQPQPPSSPDGGAPGPPGGGMFLPPPGGLDRALEDLKQRYLAGGPDAQQ